LNRLTTAGPEGFLTIQVTPPDGFLQVKWTPLGLELDHPLITTSQRRREAHFRDFCTERGYLVRDVTTSSNDRFLDCYLPSDPAAASAVVREALRELFEIQETTTLHFSGVGTGDVAL